MIWRVEKNQRASHLIGTAHFFPYSYARAFTRLTRDAATVLFEGPLDDASSARIAAYGRQGAGVLDHQNGDAWLLSLVERKPIYFESFTRGVRPWAAFFSIWQTYLGWKFSMDLQGYQIARKLSKPIHFLETLDEQLAVLDNIPLDRIARQMNDVENWERYKNEYVQIFLDGDLEKMMALTARFVTRGPVVVGARDQILFERMSPFITRAPTLAFIGFPHIPGVTQLFRDAGYAVAQVRE